MRKNAVVDIATSMNITTMTMRKNAVVDITTMKKSTNVVMATTIMKKSMNAVTDITIMKKSMNAATDIIMSTNIITTTMMNTAPVAAMTMITNTDITIIMQMMYLQAGVRKLHINLTEQELKRFLKYSAIQKIMAPSYVQKVW